MAKTHTMKTQSDYFEDEDDKKYTPEEQKYFDSLDLENQERIKSQEAEILSIRNERRAIPLRFRLLNSGMPLQQVSAAYERIECISDEKAAEYVDCLAKVPFGRYATPMLQSTLQKTLQTMRTTLDRHVFSMTGPKATLLGLAAKWLVKPASGGTVIGFQGPAGVGKTTLLKEGFGSALGLPTAFIPLGGATDVSYLHGHNFTYEGSKPGVIAQSIIDAGVMNPILVFDELDKVGDRYDSSEVISALVHLTDPAQNSTFCDKYIGLPMDLSRCLFAFTYNDRSRISPILLNRMTEIVVNDYDMQERRKILKAHILPRVAKDFGLEIELEPEAIECLLAASSEAPGLRGLKHDLECAVSAMNLERIEMGLEIDSLLKIDRDAMDRCLRLRIQSMAIPDSVKHIYC
ncbi:hypothetical protein CEUSTIGMA_g10746.t1 [Chlamydomonas eustigma]|uniref:ATPase AAA-type core domain-containing protein n=1 Tax=Chlamydomonas eustigma TaxID=1157962 RepID=A0A250XKI7_9CHLO|nr:hypothetical protein CEUSTIGMA_g10746.t1 [Chlamydomonas eustigma]|eukprot:GAX83320.1 hypothetical protein CEUSTIGMA_g10746.t1 [Chlamydomonas eustigma]